MSDRFLPLNDVIYEYLQKVSLREPDVLKRLRVETSKLPMARMQISPEQGQFMALLVQLIRARKTLEVGVFTGYSSLCVALALPAEGKVVAADISEEWTLVARRYWKAAGVASKIDLRLAPATETLDKLIAAGETGTFDFAFIDADKTNYENYYERSLTLLRPGGLITVDNVLWSGRVVDATNQEEDTVAIRAFNEKLYADERILLSMLPVGDGLTLAMKR
jgi:predicted O-methyltransferase YrrM